MRETRRFRDELTEQDQAGRGADIFECFSGVRPRVVFLVQGASSLMEESFSGFP